MVDGRPAATTGSGCNCRSAMPNAVATTSSKVILGGKPAARLGDSTEHGGSLSEGSAKVYFG